MRRLRCHLFGCRYANICCDRCWVGLHDPDYIEHGWLTLLLDAWWRYQRWRQRRKARCTQCGKSLRFRRRYSDEFCSAECFDAWIPF